MPKTPRTFGSKSNCRDHRGTKQERGYGGQWETISKLKRKHNPVCQICKEALATDVDHIIPFTSLDDPNRTLWSNLQAVCRACHAKKTARQG